MHIEISYKGLEPSQALEEHLRTGADRRFKRFASRLTRLEAHLADTNADKGGPDDKRCMIEARPAGKEPIAVERRGADFYATINETLGALEAALARRLDRD